MTKNVGPVEMLTDLLTKGLPASRVSDLRTMFELT